MGVRGSVPDKIANQETPLGPLSVQLLNHLDTLFIYLIVSLATLAIVIECRATYRDCIHRCRATAEGIRLLRSHPNEDAIPLEALNSEQVRWLLEHLDGDCPPDDPNQFYLHRQQQHIICLTYPAILTSPVPRSPVAAAPTLLTGLGVLGTFSGIYRGFQGVRLDAITSTDRLLDTSGQLLAGMQVAFATSLWGLGTASILVLLLGISERVRVWRRQWLRSQFSQIAIWRPPSQLLQRLVREAQRGDLKELQQIRQIQERQLTLFEQVQRPESTSAEGWDRLEKRVTETILEPLAQQLAQQFQHQQQLLEDSHLAIQGVSESFSQQIKPAIVTLTQEIAGMSRVQEEANQGLLGICDRLDQTLKQVQEYSQTALEQSVQMQRSLLDDVQQRTEAILEQSQGSFASQAQVLQAVGEETVATMTEARSQLMASLDTIDRLIQDSRQTVERELERFRLDYQDALDGYFSQQNELLKYTLVKQRQGLEAVVTSWRESLDASLQESLQDPPVREDMQE
ncbi:MAG: hypothetical protein HLUCCO16_10730 [Phormidium sp. OSCR]|nr:MAG: hypothetical protein HLUCCO16_10730 [Phormidium sp. OSCR]